MVIAGLVGCAMPNAVSTDASSAQASPSSRAASAEPSPTAVPRELLARHIVLDAPAVDLTLPVGWREVTVREWQEDIAGLPEDDAFRGTPFVSRLESGQVLTTAEGFTEQATNVSVEIAMTPDATTMAEAMSSVTDDLAGAGEVESVETGSVDAPVGQIARLRYVIKFTGNPETALPAHLIAYVVPMGADGTLVVKSFGAQSDDSHGEMLDEMISTLRRTESLLPHLLSRPWVGRVDGTDLTFVYPETFIPIPLDGFKTALAARSENGLPGSTPEVMRIVDGIEGGIIRALLSSRRPFGVGRYLGISIERDIDDMDEAVARTIGSLGDPEVLLRRDVSLPLGAATWLRVAVPETPVPAFDDFYVVITGEGQSLSINGRAAQNDEAFETTFEEFAESFEHQ